MVVLYAVVVFIMGLVGPLLLCWMCLLGLCPVSGRVMVEWTVPPPSDDLNMRQRAAQRHQSPVREEVLGGRVKAKVGLTGGKERDSAAR